MAEGPPASPATTDARQPPTGRRRGRARAAWRDPKVLVLAGVLFVLLVAVAAAARGRVD
jgi:hypothetical protein